MAVGGGEGKTVGGRGQVGGGRRGDCWRREQEKLRSVFRSAGWASEHHDASSATAVPSAGADLHIHSSPTGAQTVRHTHTHIVRLCSDCSQI